MKYAYWITTVLFCGVMAFSVGMYLFNYQEVASEFVKLGFPTWVIYPLAFLKLAGAATIVWYKNRSLVEWAYAGFCFNISLALVSHLFAVDGGHWTALIALVLLMSSYFLSKKVRGK